MKRKIIISTFIFVTIFQLIVLGSCVVRYESILSTGKLWKLEVQPVDPYDILRGRYVRLNFKNSEVNVENGFVENNDYYYKKDGYVTLEENESGFAKPQTAFNNPPNGEGNWIKCKLRRNYQNKTKASVIYPFDRFFMNEKLAPEADRIMRRGSDFMKNNQVYVTVRVKNGVGIVENLYVDKTPIAEFIRSKMGK